MYVPIVGCMVELVGQHTPGGHAGFTDVGIILSFDPKVHNDSNMCIVGLEVKHMASPTSASTSFNVTTGLNKNEKYPVGTICIYICSFALTDYAFNMAIINELCDTIGFE